jgi:UDP:flavonoid glycosyltransferase YjiC (YdhE family)
MEPQTSESLPMKILCFNTPTRGHVNPTLPVVAELARRGHHVIYTLSEGYRHKIEATGATFRAYETIPDDYFERRGLDGSHPERTALTLLQTCQEIVPGLVETMRADQPDVVLHDAMCPGWIAARIAGAPTVSSTTVDAYPGDDVPRAGCAADA